MPLSPRHLAQKRKNIALLLVLLALMALLYAIAMMRFGMRA